MTIQKRSTFFLGIFIFLVPFLGLPSSFKTTLIVLSGLLLVAFSIHIALPRSVVKKVAKHRKAKKEKVTYVAVKDPSMYSGAAEAETILERSESNRS
jgi:hypothetical protein